MESFDPHISLAYAEAFTGKSKDQWKTELDQFTKSLDLKSAFQFIVLMDTRIKSSSKTVEKVMEWKACPIRLAL